MYKTIIQEMRTKGYEMRVVSINHLNDLQMEIEKLYETDYLGKNIHNFLKGFYDFNKPSTSYDTNSLIIVASPSPQVKVTFNFKSQKFPILIPPTYKESIEKPKEIEVFLQEILSKNNLHVQRAHSLPEKLLAVHSGLSEYGKNNISYINGMGSFLLLSVFYSDLICDEDVWKEINQMKVCTNCSKCINSCPTTAIISERFLINAERCVTYQNEINADEYFPDWMDLSSHNCLIGCLCCQINCPQNKKFLNNIVELENFTEEETNDILEKKAFDKLPSSLGSKLEHLNLKIYYHVLARNLRVLLEQKSKL